MPAGAGSENLRFIWLVATGTDMRFVPLRAFMPATIGKGAATNEAAFAPTNMPGAGERFLPFAGLGPPALFQSAPPPSMCLMSLGGLSPCSLNFAAGPNSMLVGLCGSSPSRVRFASTPLSIPCGECVWMIPAALPTGL